jgi:hypothetical protein
MRFNNNIMRRTKVLRNVVALDGFVKGSCEEMLVALGLLED